MLCVNEKDLLICQSAFTICMLPSCTHTHTPSQYYFLCGKVFNWNLNFLNQCQEFWLTGFRSEYCKSMGLGKREIPCCFLDSHSLMLWTGA